MRSRLVTAEGLICETELDVNKTKKQTRARKMKRF